VHSYFVALAGLTTIGTTTAESWFMDIEGHARGGRKTLFLLLNTLFMRVWMRLKWTWL
jgi:hypothetical protein